MSFDLAFWYESEPSSPQQAAQIYDQLTDEDEKVGVVERNPALNDFYQEVISTYGDLTEDITENADETPWTAQVDFNGEYVITPIAWSRHREVSLALIAIAARHGLTSYDPQDRIIHYPSGRSAQ
jgi:hypothetical protein